MSTPPPVPPDALQACKELHAQENLGKMGTVEIWILAQPTGNWIAFARSVDSPRTILVRSYRKTDRWAVFHDPLEVRGLWRDWREARGECVHKGVWDKWGIVF